MSLIKFLAMLLSVALIAIDRLVMPLAPRAEELTAWFPFREALLQAILGTLLFAAALQIRFEGSFREGVRLFVLSYLVTALSVMAIALLSWWLFRQFAIELSLMHCLLFGVLITPVDPLATTRMLTTAGAEPALSSRLAGESLLNSLFCVILFMVLFGMAEPGASNVFDPPGQQVGGGVLLGAMLGLAVVYLHNLGDRPWVWIAFSLGAMVGLGVLAEELRLSAPVAGAIAGLLVSIVSRHWPVAEPVRARLTAFWSPFGEVLTAILLVWIGIELILSSVPLMYVAIGVFTIPVVIMTRMVSVSLPVLILGMRRRGFTQEAVRLMAWGGLRGGLAVVLALSLPSGPESAAIVTATFMILLFSMFLQGPAYGLRSRKQRPLAGIGFDDGKEPGQAAGEGSAEESAGGSGERAEKESDPKPGH